MYSHFLWHRALKLNKGIYKITETVSDAEILKKQLREQANEILSTISVFCHRESAKQDGSLSIHSVIASSNSSSSLRGSSAPEAISPSASLKFQISSAPRSESEVLLRGFKSHDYYLPESEICLMLLLDKITVLKTFLFLAKEHNFFNEEKHQILAAACAHLSESVQSELSGADIFSHPVFNSPVGSPEVVPPLEVRPPNINSASVIAIRQPADSKHSFPVSPEAVPPSAPSSVLSASAEVVPPLGGATSKHSHSGHPDDSFRQPVRRSASPEIQRGEQARPADSGRSEETLSDILDNISDIARESVSDISAKVAPSASPTHYSPPTTPLASPKKSRQNKSYKSYLPKFLNISSREALAKWGSSRQQNNQNRPSNSAEVASPFYPIYPSAISIAVESPQIDFPAVYSAPSVIASREVPLRGISRRETISAPSAFPEFRPPQHYSAVPGGRNSQNSPSNSLSENPIRVHLRSHPRESASLTSRQQKLYDFILQNNKAKIGDLTPLFPEKISEKTIRRDLQVLIDKSLVSQSGSRRWTCYSIA